MQMFLLTLKALSALTWSKYCGVIVFPSMQRFHGEAVGVETDVGTGVGVHANCVCAIAVSTVDGEGAQADSNKITNNRNRVILKPPSK